MTCRYLLDTSIVSAPVSKFPNREILKRLERHGHECAIAHANGLVLVTSNTKDFARFKDLELENWH